MNHNTDTYNHLHIYLNFGVYVQLNKTNMKLYLLPDSIMSIPKQTIIEYMNENGLKEITVHEAKLFKDPDYMYCRLHGMGERGYCGKSWCKDYQPRNGKSGCCKHLGNLYEEGKEVTI